MLYHHFSITLLNFTIIYHLKFINRKKSFSFLVISDKSFIVANTAILHLMLLFYIFLNMDSPFTYIIIGFCSEKHMGKLNFRPRKYSAHTSFNVLKLQGYSIIIQHAP